MPCPPSRCPRLRAVAGVIGCPAVEASLVGHRPECHGQLRPQRDPRPLSKSRGNGGVRRREQFLGQCTGLSVPGTTITSPVAHAVRTVRDCDAAAIRTTASFQNLISPAISSSEYCWSFPKRPAHDAGERLMSEGVGTWNPDGYTPKIGRTNKRAWAGAARASRRAAQFFWRPGIPGGRTNPSGGLKSATEPSAGGWSRNTMIIPGTPSRDRATSTGSPGSSSSRSRLR